MAPRTMAADTVAEALLGLLRQRGVDYLFANAGTDSPSVVEGLAKAAALGTDMPAALPIAHENAAVAMAHGYTLMTGRPQAVMLHVTVGTANALCGIMNAARDNVPILIAAGRTPLTETGRFGSRNVFIHWGQEMFDQAGIVREHVKWDYELRGGDQLEAVIDRALALAMSEPRGPVYLSLPREVLAEQLDGFSYAHPPRQQPAAASHPDPEAVARAAAILAEADNPLIVTQRAGRDPGSLAALSAFAEAFALPVVEYRQRAISLPSEHLMHQGFDFEPWADDVDAVLVLDSDAPWIPADTPLGVGCPVVQVGPDPLFGRYPLRSFPTDVAITARSSVALRALHGALAERMAGQEEAIAARRLRWTAMHRQRRERVLAQVAQAPAGAITAAWLSRCIDQVLDDDAVIFNENPLALPVMTFGPAHECYSPSPAGGLGWGLPAALGAKLAAPERQVVAVVGDGSYMFANPVVCHQIAAALTLPVLTVVFNNGMWGAVKRATQALYPDGAAMRSNQMPLSSLEPSPQFETVIEASGGFGERVEAPEALPDALARAVAATREGRQALLNAAIA